MKKERFVHTGDINIKCRVGESKNAEGNPLSICQLGAVFVDGKPLFEEKYADLLMFVATASAPHSTIFYDDTVSVSYNKTSIDCEVKSYCDKKTGEDVRLLVCGP